MGAMTRSRQPYKMKLYQETLPEGQVRMPVIHLPKTIDNDYSGIDFTFGYFSAAENVGRRDPKLESRRVGWTSLLRV